MRVCTVEQEEAEHPGLKGKLRDWNKQAYAGNPDYAWFTLCIIRVGRTVLIDDVRLRDMLYQRTALPPAPPRNPEGKTRPEGDDADRKAVTAEKVQRKTAGRSARSRTREPAEADA
jgi:hypothetical protein